MRIPERPQNLADLDLMKRLRAYSDGTETWHLNKEPLGNHERKACGELYTNLTTLIEKCVHPLMDRVTSREMQGFTMHDHGHGLKVAHLMWHIVKPERRELLSPGEIALLVISAHLHDLGMGLSQEDRDNRLRPDSDLWDKVDIFPEYANAISGLQQLANQADTPVSMKAEAVFQIQQAQEALLCVDTRERHALKERYQEILSSLEQMHDRDRTGIPDILAALSFDGDSFKSKLIDVCVSHNEDAHVLLEHDPNNFDQFRFPTQYPIGCCFADIRFVAAALRLADILDFDRERTPPVLFHYLLPRSANPKENTSIREWSKHLAISNWEIEHGKIIFRGRSASAFIHHTILQFCTTIEDEIARTQSIFGVNDWPFCIQQKVEAVIEAVGYRYAPYQFSLDEERIYELLMGRNIYPEPLDALRELVQNAVDACKLRDGLMIRYDNSVIPSREGRIIVKLEERDERPPILHVIDTGIGMDRYVIENYFLKVGRSYYKSADFLRTRSELRKQNVDFKPISEFGIGFMTVFMLGDYIEVETALSVPIRGDAQRRTLRIDGLGKLIEIAESQNVTVPRFQGTRVSIRLRTQGSDGVPEWKVIEKYIRRMCINLEYPLYLQHATPNGVNETQVLPEGLKVPVPDYLADAALRIEVDDSENGLKGEIVIFREREGKAAEKALASSNPVQAYDPEDYRHRQRNFFSGSGVLLRGGFNIGPVPGLPGVYDSDRADARIEVTKDRAHPRFLPITDLARSRLLQDENIQSAVFKIWMKELLQQLDDLDTKPIGSPSIQLGLLRQAKWLEKYNAFDLYHLAKTAWQTFFDDFGKARERISLWEDGKVDRLWIGSAYSTDKLHWGIFELILPRITNLIVAEDTTHYTTNYYVEPPHQNWKQEFQKWNSFISEGLTWPKFAVFEKAIETVLYGVAGRSHFLNSRYKEKFANFSLDEITRLFRIFDTLVHAKRAGGLARIVASDIQLLNKAVETAGDLDLYYLGSRYKLASLVASN